MITTLRVSLHPNLTSSLATCQEEMRQGEHICTPRRAKLPLAFHPGSAPAVSVLVREADDVGISYDPPHAAFSYRPPVRPMSGRSLETAFLRPSFSVTHSAPLGVGTRLDRVPRFLRFLASRSRFPALFALIF